MMNISGLLQIVLGIVFSLFLPGFILTLIFFKELKFIEKAVLGVALSLALDIATAIFLGYNEYMKNLTGGITANNVWTYSLTISGFLIIVYVVKSEIEWLKKRKKRRSPSS
ncbi:hypothetical protein JW930_01145 [Candidatus Woesearchaeota archaeon]|nr:hypothetical protein [Candidatus Woesearchaeota archaeon]